MTFTRDVFLALEISSLIFGTLEEHPRTFGTLSENTLNSVVLSLYVRTGYNSLEVRPTDFRTVALPWL